MSELATTYLRQARSFLRSGDPHRAVELLERAKLLSRDNREVLGSVLEELSGAYGSAGQPDRAARCRDQLSALGPAASVQPAYGQPAYGQPAYGQPAYGPPAYGPSPSAWAPPATRSPRGPRRRGIGVWLGVAAVFLALAGITLGIYLWPWRAKPALSPVANLTTPTPATQPLAALPTPLPSPVVPPVVAVPIPPPAPAAPPAPPTSSAGALGDRLKDNVGLLVVMAHYQGTVSGKVISVEVPTSMGTAFAVDPGGLMLTCRHVVEGEKGEIPPTLESEGLPTLTRRRVEYLVCFGPEAKDHYKATVVLSSKHFDVALVRIGRQFTTPLGLALGLPQQGDDVLVCGFPGAVVKMLNGSSSQSDARREQFLKKARATGNFDLLLEEFSPDSYNSTLTRGIVSASERNIDGVSYLQTDAAANPGNSGGPVLNARQQVVGIVALKIGEAGMFDKYCFALLLAQLKDELSQYIKFD